MSIETGTPTAPVDSEARFDAVIVGAGFAGMYMLHKLRALGMSARVFDAANGVGGTWYWNRYPGARCDVVSVDYSYSFSDAIEQEWTWSEKFAAQPEILRYAEFVANKLDLLRDIQFNTRVETTIYDDILQNWRIATSDGKHVTAQFIIMATGCLSIPKDPNIRGLENFAGPRYFTSRWPHETVDFTNKTVGVIGTGSSGIQVVPELALDAGSLLVFQRTPSFSLPARNADLPNEFVAGVKASYRERRALARRHPAGHLRPLTTRETLSFDAETRQIMFEGAWKRGGLELFGEFGDLGVDEQANVEIARLIHDKIDTIVTDKTVAELLKPRSEPLGGRRICLDTDYYDTFNRANVTLVDVCADPIEEIVADGIRTRDSHYRLDALVLATGFDAMTGALLGIDIRGKGGCSLTDKWASGPASYLGIAIAGFPNFFTITGPGSPSVLTNVIASIEQHVEWLGDLFTHMTREGLNVVEAEPDAEAAWVRHTFEVAAPTLMMRANSWYLGANVPGKPRVFMPYAGGLDVYRDKCDEIAADNYRGFYFLP